MSDQPATKGLSLAGDQFRRSPVLYVMALVVFVNWFVFFAISMHFGGDALGIMPSVDGFVLTSHGNRTPVTESVWLFSLIYPYCTLMLTPAVFILFAVRQKPLRNVAFVFKGFVILFLCVWVFGWYGSITRSFLRSLHDYEKVRSLGAATSHRDNQQHYRVGKEYRVYRSDGDVTQARWLKGGFLKSRLNCGGSSP